MQMWDPCDLSIMHGTGIVVSTVGGATVARNLSAGEAERVLR